jgi:tetratricopeptide (TPR) repeat protein
MQKYLKLITAAIILIIVSVLALPLKANNNLYDVNDDINALFKQANQLYQDGNYNNAIDTYKKLVNQGINNGHLYYNLANAYLKNEQVGKAILNYRKAELLLPRNADIKANLKFAREQTYDQIATGSDIEPVLKILAFWYYDLNLTEIIVLTIVINFIVCGILVIKIFFKNNILKIVAIAGIIILVILFVSTSIKLINYFRITDGVVITNQAKLKSGHDDSYADLDLIHEGTEFQIDDQKKEWYKIKLKDGRRGWVNKKSIEIINLTI